MLVSFLTCEKSVKPTSSSVVFKFRNSSHNFNSAEFKQTKNILMNTIDKSYDIYSPRWGHTDRYTVVLTPDEIEIGTALAKTRCFIGDNGDPEWPGYDRTAEHPLQVIWRNDHIHVPDAVPDALEAIWWRWRNGEVEDDTLLTELDDLFEWVNAITSSRPSNELLQTIF